MANLITVLDLSVAHLSPAARGALDAAAADALHRMEGGRAAPSDVTLVAPRAARDSPGDTLIVTPMVYGWFCHCPDDTAPLLIAGVPEDLIAIFRHARRHGACYVLFDVDADEDDALPLFPSP